MLCHEPEHFAWDCPRAVKESGKGGLAEPGRATVLMEPELCAATHHMIYDLMRIASETSLGFPAFLQNEFQDRVLEPVVAKESEFRRCSGFAR